MAQPFPITVRSLTTRAECEACVQLQRDVWGTGFADLVPATILMVSQRVGGVTAGAFDPSTRLVGFVFGLSGFERGHGVHWSDMLAVRPEARGHGIGARLKLFQRHQLLERGVELVYWSYDPLVARNANLNLNRLAAVPTEYVVDMYGDTGSPLHEGLATDRLIVEWRLRDPVVDAAMRGRPPGHPPLGDAPLVTLDTATMDDARLPSLPEAPRVRLAIPSSIAELKRVDATWARRWQRLVRHAFTYYLGRGYQVEGFVRQKMPSDDPYYILSVQSVRSPSPR